MKQLYKSHKFGDDTRERIRLINQIIGRYETKITLRQLYYQLVKSNVIPNRKQEYGNLSKLLTKARLAGLVDWDAIEDRGREFKISNHWNYPSRIIRAIANQFDVDKWEGQPYYVEVFIEKDALSGVIEPVCDQLDVGFFACKGYSSITAIRDAGLRMQEAIRDDRKCVIIHLGDHDPSGVDMTRDIEDRINLFTTAPVEVRRVALTMAQIEMYDLVPQPAKMGDGRAEKYAEEHGQNSWELDALDPAQLTAIIEEHVQELCDQPLWDARREEEEEKKAELRKVSDNWVAVVAFSKDLPDADNDIDDSPPDRGPDDSDGDAAEEDVDDGNSNRRRGSVEELGGEDADEEYETERDDFEEESEAAGEDDSESRKPELNAMSKKQFAEPGKKKAVKKKAAPKKASKKKKK